MNKQSQLQIESFFNNLICGLAWATGRVDFKLLRAGKDNKKGNEKCCEKGNQTNNEKGNKQRYEQGHEKGDQREHEQTLLI